MPRRERPSIAFRDAEFIYRTNFRGEKQKYNENGRKEFNVVIPTEDMAESLRADGWNVKQTNPREEGDRPTYYLPVTVSYDYYPPDIYMIDNNTRRATKLDDDTVGQLDYADIVRVNLEVSGYSWEVNGKSGIKAYASRLNAFIKPNPFADDFDVPGAVAEEDVPF